LSHMVGSSNRIDIARLRGLEQELEERNAKILRQPSRLKSAADERVTLVETARKLGEALAARDRPAPAAIVDGEAETLRRKLEQEQSRCALLSARVTALEQELRAAQARSDRLAKRDS